MSSSEDMLTPDMLLVDYALGTLDEAESLMIATHLALCAEARRKVAEIEAVGGALIDRIDPCAVSGGLLDRVLCDIDGTCDDDAPREIAGRALNAPEFPFEIPAPLAPYILPLRETQDWRRPEDGMRCLGIEITSSTAHVMLEIQCFTPGFHVPSHKHAGMEITLVLEGAYEDETGSFARGDLSIIRDPEQRHAPSACDKQGCTCLILTVED